MALTLKDRLQDVGDFAQQAITPRNVGLLFSALGSATSPQALAGLQQRRLAEDTAMRKQASDQQSAGVDQLTSGIELLEVKIAELPQNSPEVQGILPVLDLMKTNYKATTGSDWKGISTPEVLAGTDLAAQRAKEGVSTETAVATEQRAEEITRREEKRNEQEKIREENRKAARDKAKGKTAVIQNWEWTDAEGKKQRGFVDVAGPNAQAELAKMKERGAIAIGKPQRVTTGTPVEMLEGPIDKTHARGLRKQLDKDKSAIAELTIAMDALEKAPGAAGVSGAIVDNKFMNMLSQLPGGKGVREGISQTIAGTSASEIVAIRTRARTIVASQLSAITGEEGNRFTEQEREIAENTLRGLKASNDVETIRSAYRVVMELNISSRDKNREGLGIKPKHDVTTKDGRASFYAELRERGFGADEAITYIKGRVKEARLNE